ncbi:sigma-70 family RNA polymerase sigma factor [Streptacidiphilus carbonis]|uniref:sigma-70 family RNA polymerase sigma factor n=1 Tax=Streptacidiphilus carbonis TaxID=105422 RepID=UPI0005A7B27F|nr:sigma-70 family RNA polymerase sigma factor [Streptacidiphilus carbonis]
MDEKHAKSERSEKHEKEFLAQRFEEHRGHLRSVAYRMLGSLTEADDAVQEAWLRLSRTDERADAEEIENLGGWLTTVVARVSLSMLRSRRTRREESLDAQVFVPDPIIDRIEGPNPGGSAAVDPEQQALLADSVGLALLVVLQQLAPAERLAFVLHDMFAVPFEEIAPIVERTPAAARQLASRARRRVQGTAPVPDPDIARQREVVDAFLAAARGGDFEALVSVLDPDVVLRADAGALTGAGVGPGPGATSRLVRGAHAVAAQALSFRSLAQFARPVLVNGGYGLVAAPGGVPVSVLGFTVANGRIVEMNLLADPERLSRLDLTVLGAFPAAAEDDGTGTGTGTD